jgi:two-component system, NarL family, sensor histidine kinase DegS
MAPRRNGLENDFSIIHSSNNAEGQYFVNSNRPKNQVMLYLPFNENVHCSPQIDMNTNLAGVGNMALIQTGQNSGWNEFLVEILNEYDQTKRALSEITLMLDQSQTELAKLSQRNAMVTGHIQQVQSNFETMPRADMRDIFMDALDAQQRLLVMRGQLEKLQGDQAGLQRHLDWLEKTRAMIGEPDSAPKKKHQRPSGENLIDQIMEAQENERRHLSEMMHDGPAQTMSNFIVQTEIVGRLMDMDVARAKAELESLKVEAKKTFDKVRAFVSQLEPMTLNDLGLIPALERYVDEASTQSSTEINLNVKGAERRLEHSQAIMIYRGVEELVENSLRHNSEQTEKLIISLQVVMEEDLIKVTVSDNGIGFDPNSEIVKRKTGLRTLKERVEMVDGYMEIASVPGSGCRITFQVPVYEINSEQ